MNKYAISLMLLLAVSCMAEVASNDRGRVEFSYYCPTAYSVELVGSFNEWNRIPMDKDKEGYFKTRIYLPPGEYEYYYLVNRVFRRMDPDNPASSGKNSTLNLNYGSMLDYTDNTLFIGLAVNFQASVQIDDFKIFERFLKELTLLDIPVNITFNEVYLKHLEENYRLKELIDRNRFFYMLGTAKTHTYLPLLRNRTLKDLQVSEWKKTYNSLFSLTPSVFVAPYLGNDLDVVRLAEKNSYKGILALREQEYYPYFFEGCRTVVYPTMSVTERMHEVILGRLHTQCLQYLRDATEDGYFYPFLSLYVEIGSDMTLKLLQDLVRRIKELKKESYFRFISFHEYHPSIIIKRPVSDAEKLYRPYHFRFTSSYLDLFYRDKFAYWLKYLRYNKQGETIMDERHPFLDKAMENWFLREETFFQQAMHELNNEYVTVVQKKPVSGYRKYEGDNFFILENREFQLTFDKQTAKLVEVHLKGKQTTYLDLSEKNRPDTFMNSESVDKFHFLEYKGNRVTFFAKLKGRLEGFILEKTYEIRKRGTKLYLTYRLTNPTQVSRSTHLRYTGLGVDTKGMTGWKDRFPDITWSVKSSEFIRSTGKYLETRAFTLKPGMKKTLFLEISVEN